MSLHSHNSTSGSGGKWHKDWRLWAVVILMLAGMAIYVLSLDESSSSLFFGP